MDQTRRSRKSSFTEHVQRILRVENQANRTQSDPDSLPILHQQVEANARDEGGEGSVDGLTGDVRQPANDTKSAATNTVSEEQLPSGNGKKSNSRPKGLLFGDDKNGKNKEKRVTRRLEAERKELENRLKQLEAQSSGSNERASRRLIKKRPPSNSSRDSSMSAGESLSSRASFASFFSASRRSSRSQSSSTNRSHAPSWPESIDLPNHYSQGHNGSSTAPSLDSNLPERSSQTTSREPANQNTAVLAGPKSMTQPQRSLQTAAGALRRWGSRKVSQAVDENGCSLCEHQAISQQGPKSDQARVKHAIPKKSSTMTALNRSADLSFALSSDLNKRTLGSSPKEPTTSSTAGNGHSLPSRQVAPQTKGHGQPQGRPQTTHPVIPKLRSDIPTLLSYQSIRQDVMKPSATPSSPFLQGVSPKPSSIRNLSDKSSRSYNTTFKSSPLAAAPAMSASVDLSVETKSTTFISTSRTFKNRAQMLPSEAHASGGLLTSKSESSHTVSSCDHHRTEKARAQGNSSTATLIDPSPLRTKLETESDASQIHGKHQLKVKGNRRRFLPSFITLSDPATDSLVKQTDASGNPSLKGKSPVSYDPKSKPAIMEGVAVRLNPLTENASSSRSGQSSDISFCKSPPDQPIHSPERPPSACSSQEPHHEDNYETAEEDAGSTAGSRENLPSTHSHHQSSHGHLPRVSVSKDTISRSGWTALTANGATNTQQSDIPEPLEQGHTLTKVFVICCNCNIWHDMPSEVYARLRPMTNPPKEPRAHPCSSGTQGLESNEEHHEKRSFAGPNGTSFQDPQRGYSNRPQRKQLSHRPTGSELSGSNPTSLRCCWCEHQMLESCCHVWTTAVQLRERLPNA